MVFSSCELGVFDLLLGAERPLSAEEISEAVGASVDGTERLLAACAGLQLLNIHQDNGRSRRPPPTHTHTQPDPHVFMCICDFTLPVSPCSSILLWFFFSPVFCSVLYSNTEQASAYLTRSSPVSLSQSIQYSSRTIYLCWHYLTDAVR